MAEIRNAASFEDQARLLRLREEIAAKFYETGLIIARIAHLKSVPPNVKLVKSESTVLQPEFVHSFTVGWQKILYYGDAGEGCAVYDYANGICEPCD